MPQPRKIRGNSEVARKAMRSKDIKKSSIEMQDKRRINSMLGDLSGGMVNYYGGIIPAQNWLRDGESQSRTEKRYEDQRKRRKEAKLTTKAGKRAEDQADRRSKAKAAERKKEFAKKKAAKSVNVNKVKKRMR
jgi:hypothetical protein